MGWNGESESPETREGETGDEQDSREARGEGNDSGQEDSDV